MTHASRGNSPDLAHNSWLADLWVKLTAVPTECSVELRHHPLSMVGLERTVFPFSMRTKFTVFLGHRVPEHYVIILTYFIVQIVSFLKLACI